MKSIQEQIEALTQELRPYPKDKLFYYFDEITEEIIEIKAFDSYVNDKHTHFRTLWHRSLFASTNKAEVEEYADCYRRLKLYQLLGKKAEKEFPVEWLDMESPKKYATDFYRNTYDGGIYTTYVKSCVLGSVWFSREEDRLEALKICGITKELQEKCSKYGLGGA